jgi:hypothetical protein
LSLQYFNGVQVACPLWVKIDDISRLWKYIQQDTYEKYQ